MSFIFIERHCAGKGSATRRFLFCFVWGRSVNQKFHSHPGEHFMVLVGICIFLILPPYLLSHEASRGPRQGQAGPYRPYRSGNVAVLPGCKLYRPPPHHRCNIGDYQQITNGQGLTTILGHRWADVEKPRNP